VIETTLNDLPEIGSVCSGGRYDELASLYTEKRLPGVGASVGLDRLLSALEALGKAKNVPLSTKVLIIHEAHSELARLHHLAATLRNNGIAAEVYPESKKRLWSNIIMLSEKHIPLRYLFQNLQLRVLSF